MDTEEMKKRIVGLWEYRFDGGNGLVQLAFSPDGKTYQHVRVNGRGMVHQKSSHIEGIYTIEEDILCIHWKELGIREGGKFTWKEISNEVRRPIAFIDYPFYLKVYGDDDAEIYNREGFAFKNKKHNEIEAEELYRDSIDYIHYKDVDDWKRKAFDCVLRAAEGGFKKAQVTIGYWYCTGQYVEKDYEKGIMWLKLAVKNEARFARSLLNYFYRKGIR